MKNRLDYSWDATNQTMKSVTYDKGTILYAYKIRKCEYKKLKIYFVTNGEEGRAADGGPGGSVRIRTLHS